MKNQVKVLPPRQTAAGSSLLWDLRALKDVVLPEGISRIGDYWFMRTDIQSACISGSVKEIGREAFFECKQLKRVLFEPDCLLQRVEESCF